MTTRARKKGPRSYVLNCHGERHHVQITKHGVVFCDHADAGEVWGERARAEAMAALCGGDKERPIGCFEVAALVRDRRYIAPFTPSGGARSLLAALRGIQSFRSAARRRRAS